MLAESVGGNVVLLRSVDDGVYLLFTGIFERDVDAVLGEELGHAATHAAAADHGDLLNVEAVGHRGGGLGDVAEFDGGGAVLVEREAEDGSVLIIRLCSSCWQSA